MTPKMRREMKAKELKKLTELGSDVPEHLLPTPLTIPSTPTPYPIKMATFNKLFWQTGTQRQVFDLVLVYWNSFFFFSFFVFMSLFFDLIPPLVIHFESISLCFSLSKI